MESTDTAETPKQRMALEAHEDIDSLMSQMNDLARFGDRFIGQVMALVLRLRASIRELEEVTQPAAEPLPPNALPRMTIAEFKDLLTQKEVAKQVGVCTITLRKMYLEGRFPQPIRLTSRQLRFRRTDVERWMRGDHDPAGQSASHQDRHIR